MSKTASLARVGLALDHGSPSLRPAALPVALLQVGEERDQLLPVLPGTAGLQGVARRFEPGHLPGELTAPSRGEFGEVVLEAPAGQVDHGLGAGQEWLGSRMDGRDRLGPGRAEVEEEHAVQVRLVRACDGDERTDREHAHARRQPEPHPNPSAAPILGSSCEIRGFRSSLRDRGDEFAE